MQRLLAHKVAQYHGLQTSTADYEGPPHTTSGRVVAHRRPVETKVGLGTWHKLMSYLDWTQLPPPFPDAEPAQALPASSIFQHSHCCSRVAAGR